MTATSPRPRRHPDSAFRAVGEEGGLVVLAGRAEIKVVNTVAIRIFELLDGTRTPEQIADVVTSEYDVEREVALAHVRVFLEELSSHGMLADEEPTS